MKYLASLVALAFCLLLGCSKATSNKVEKSKAEATAKPANLGVIEVADGVETLRDLGGGKTCRILPTFQKDGNVVLQMTIEKDGQILSKPRVQAPFDMPVSIFDGTTEVSFTAHKKP